MSPEPIEYFDRQTGQLVSDPIYAPRFLDWSYDTALGQAATDLVFSHPIVSRLYGWFYRQRWNRREIQRFAERLGVNLDECLQPVSAFRSLNDFVTRDIDLARRPIDANPNVCVSPVDGRALAFPKVSADATFQIKSATFNLRHFLRDEDLAQDFSNGALWVGRLYLADYHHFHFPADGSPGPPMLVPGRCFAATPYSLKRPVPFYAENRRMMTALESDRFGRILMVEVGAFTIGSIQQHYRAGMRVSKGEHKGFFELGGSVVALVFQPGAIHFDEDLCENTRRGIETFVRLGESIGHAPTAGVDSQPTSGKR